MKKQIVVVGLLVIAVAAVLIIKNAGKTPPPGDTLAAGEVSAVATLGSVRALPKAAPQGKAIPRLVDLGAGKCIPCKMMAPILEELKKECAETFEVEFIDVWENRKAGEQYGVRVIPTQIFYDADGKELFRHEGFFGKKDILAKWKEFGVELAE